MIQLKNIKKSYITGTFKQQALKDFSVNFRQNEFVAILGPSGSGKSTLLNILGGLDQYDSGDVIINGKSTKNFKDINWDAYRNKCIGFVFQNYNLISHISVLANIEISMTLSGISSSQRRKKALEVLKKVKLREHAHKKPNQLSGGQMQRVAIARALVNNPDIILADEPTGALDSTTSIQIMDLIKEIAKEKLVIMVTHNSKLAYTYANRIIELEDGELISDSNPFSEEDKKDKFNIKKTSMNFLTALKLSFNNIKTKINRTLLTSFASSIGIIGVALILSLSNGFDIQINKFETNTLSSLPVMISETSMILDSESMSKMKENNMNNFKFPKEKEIYPYESVIDKITHKNIFTKEYMDYIEKIDNTLLSGISYTRATNLNLLTKVDDIVKPVINDYNNSQGIFNQLAIPKKINNKNSYLELHYDLLYGNMPSNYNEILLVVNGNNGLNNDVIESLGLDITKEKIAFEDFIGKEYKIITNNEYYINLNGSFTVNPNFKEMYENSNTITLKISGIIRINEDTKMGVINEGIAYQEELLDYMISLNKESDIVLSQQELNYNIITKLPFKEGEKEQMLGYLGADTYPVLINIYPIDFDSKEKIVDYLDKYNSDKEEDEKIIYTDLAATVSSLSSNIMNAITIVLVAFSSISLVVSSIMIGIITYISVLERTKEIGILRAVGARKKDITRVFNAETFIIGLTSGILGLLIARLLIIPANMLLFKLTNIENIARLNIIHALILLLISILLTMIGGFIPAKLASKKDPVEALRTE